MLNTVDDAEKSNSLLKVFVSVLALVIVALLVVLPSVSIFAPSSTKVPTLIELNQGETTATIAHRLYQLGVVRNPLLLRGYMRITNRDKALKVGEFLIPPRASVADISLIVTDATKHYFHKLTLPEGYTRSQLYALLYSTPLLTGYITYLPPEGRLMPETYYYLKGEPRQSVITRMQKSMSTYLKQAWANRDPNLPLQSMKEALILASIVEKETAVSAERSIIASVFLNRLSKHMRLQSDPTVAYGLHMNNAAKLTEADLKKFTRYNTYRIKGLPPAPICNPGKDSIQAVLHPVQTQYMYFVANGSGGHSFSTNLADHTQNVRAWLFKRAAEQEFKTSRKASR